MSSTHKQHNSVAPERYSEDAPFGDRPSSNTVLSADFVAAADRAVRAHTGDSHVYLDREVEADLSRTIKAAKGIEARLDELEQTYSALLERSGEITGIVAKAKHESRLQEARSAYLSALRLSKAGEAAAAKLFDCNLHYAIYLARASMGMHPESEDEHGLQGVSV